MAVAYASIATATVDETGGNGSAITIAKPSSLAEGDFMLCVISYSDGTEGQGFALSGWTDASGSPTDDGNLVTTILTKVASSADAAASDFTFTKTAGDEAEAVCGALLRITGSSFDGASNLTAIDKGTSSDASATYTGGVTPTASSLLVFLATAGLSGTTTASGYAIVTSDPTWTERADINSTDSGSGSDNTLAIATATRTESTATGNFSLTWASDVGDSVGHLLSIQETTNVTASPSVQQLTASIQAPSVTGDANTTVGSSLDMTASIQAPTVTTADSKWNNESKSDTSPTITNESKS